MKKLEDETNYFAQDSVTFKEKTDDIKKERATMGPEGPNMGYE